MGSISTPGVPKPPVPESVPASPQGEGLPPTPQEQPAAPLPSRRFMVPDKKVPLGPKVSTIFGALVAVAVITWMVLKLPQNLPVVTLPKYVAFEANLEQGSPLDCRAPACLLVVLGTDLKAQGSIPAVVQMAQGLEEKGVETTFVVSGAELKECARVAYLFRRPVLLDPNEEIQKALKFSRPPCWIVHDPSGRIRHRSGEPMTESQVLREAGL